MSISTTGASRSPAMDGRQASSTSDVPAPQAQRESAADAIRRQLADLEVNLAQASVRLQRAKDGLTAAEVEQMRAEVRNQRAALAALVDEQSPEAKPASKAFAGAGHLVLKGNTAWSVALSQSA